MRSVGVNPVGALELIAESGWDVYVTDKLPHLLRGSGDIDLYGDTRPSSNERVGLSRILLSVPPLVEPDNL
jgi:hypothetical protein